MAKVLSKEKIRSLAPGESATFPIGSLETVRNNVSLLNAQFYREGRRYRSETSKEEGIITVVRVS